MAEVIPLRANGKAQVGHQTPIGEALVDLLANHKTSKGVIIAWDEEAKDWVFWSSVTYEELAWLSIFMGKIATE